MATHSSKTAASKPSFASIAAMAPPTPNRRSAMHSENEKPPTVPSSKAPNQTTTAGNTSSDQLHRELQDSMSRLAVKPSPMGPILLTDQGKSSISRAGLRLEDDQTQTSSSSTKPASLDGKSTTSGTNITLDEKESLRPDDSASVKATDDDELGSGPASGAQNSRVSSEAGNRAFRDQFHEITESIGTVPHRLHPLSRRKIAGIEEEGPQPAHPQPTTTVPASVGLVPHQLGAVAGPSIEYQYQEPDEKLYEALQSPKDRLFLLGLEQQVITFIRDSTEPLIDLPPCNSFCRLLAHKLADYYALTHFVDNAVSSVRLYRTPYCRIPTPLSTLVAAPPVDNPPSSQPTMKIMRRAGLGKDSQNGGSGADTAETSMAPSKAGSETGPESQQNTGVASPTDSSLAKDKSAMTREEREAKYKETRERIFGPESELVDGNETVSRTSSRNDKKKKKYRNTDDGFTARSQYNAYYPHMQYPATSFEQTTDCPAYFSAYIPQGNGAISQPNTMGVTIYQQGFQQDYQSMAHSQGYQASMNANPMIGGYEMQNPAVYNQPIPSQYFPPMQYGTAMGQQVSEMSSPALSNNGQFTRPQSQMSDQQWQQSNYGFQYQQARDQQQFMVPQMSNDSSSQNAHSVPYQYGQLPMQPGMPGGKAQHPVPGSYKSQAFNPQTRAFIPNGGPGSTSMAHPGNSPGHSISRNAIPPLQPGMNLPSYPPPTNVYPQMMTPTPSMPSMPLPPPFNFGHESRVYGTRKSSAHSNGPQSPAQSSLSKWGTPANLPPKPPPQAPSIPAESQHSLPLNNQFNVNVQPINGGQPMPSYQNGVWSLPNANPQAT